MGKKNEINDRRGEVCLGETLTVLNLGCIEIGNESTF